MRLPATIPPDLFRFAAVIVAGLAIDLSVGFLLAELVGLPLLLSAAAGFFAGAAFNYVLHELWTFRSTDDRLSIARASLYLVTSLVTLGVRLAVVALLSPLSVGAVSRFAVLAAAAGVSFFANYLLSRFAVYRRAKQPGGDPHS